jgi:hypothetical protein
LLRCGLDKNNGLLLKKMKISILLRYINLKQLLQNNFGIHIQDVKNMTKIDESMIVEGNDIQLPYTQYLQYIFINF